MKDVVLDNSVLSAFSKIQRLELLKEVLEGHRICIAETVFREIAFKDVLDEVILDKKTGGWINLEKVDVSDFKDPSIDDGEAGTVKIALQNKALAVIDDLDGRRFAAKHGVTTIGTLSLLRRAYEKNLITFDELKKILADLETKDAFRMNEELKQWVLRK